METNLVRVLAMNASKVTYWKVPSTGTVKVTCGGVPPIASRIALKKVKDTSDET